MSVSVRDRFTPNTASPTTTLGGRRTDDDDVKLKTSFQQLMLNLTRDGLETDVGVGTNVLRMYLGHFSQ